MGLQFFIAITMMMIITSTSTIPFTNSIASLMLRVPGIKISRTSPASEICGSLLLLLSLCVVLAAVSLLSRPVLP